MTEFHRHLGKRMLFTTGTRGTEQQESRQQEALRLEFLQAIPSASRMIVSELRMIRHHTPDGCVLEYVLVVRPEASGAQGVLFPAGEDLGTRFSRDVENVMQEVENVAERIALATSPAISYRDLNDSSQEAEDLKYLRSLFRRRPRTLVLPSEGGGKEMVLEGRPAELPTRVHAWISARVDGLEPGQAMLSSLKMLTDAKGMPWSEASGVALPFAAALNSTRHGSLTSESTLAMLHGMDAGAPMQLEVHLSFDWASGVPKTMEVVSARAAI